MADLPHDIIALSAPNLCMEYLEQWNGKLAPSSGTDKQIRTVYLYCYNLHLYLQSHGNTLLPTSVQAILSTST